MSLEAEVEHQYEMTVLPHSGLGERRALRGGGPSDTRDRLFLSVHGIFGEKIAVLAVFSTRRAAWTAAGPWGYNA